jgi:hypothetical protein
MKMHCLYQRVKISTFKDRLEDYHESCERERIELEKIKKEKESI